MLILSNTLSLEGPQRWKMTENYDLSESKHEPDTLLSSN